MEKNTANIRTAEFAKMCGTSKRTLIHYENIGLFSPERREENGYRYYSEQQYELFQIIDTLRSLGMPLSEIKDYLEQRSPDTLTGLLDTQARQVEAELARLLRIQRIIRTKRALLEERRQIRFDAISFLTLPEETLILSEFVDSADTDRASEALRSHLTHISRNGLHSGHPFGAMIDSRHILQGNLSHYAYFFTKVEANAAPVDAFRKPAGLYAVIHLQGDYRKPEAAYRALLSAIQEEGYRPCGYSYKEGIIDEVATQNTVDFITRISLQVERKK